ncbi:MAG: hypothetical protein MRK02_17330 [Candidatus Scalindua sp.]|nr:hypothetical protein [Candidatus Scalindua sp.]
MIDSHQDSFSGVIVDDDNDPLNFFFKSFLGEECDPEEDAKKKQRILQGHYLNGGQLIHHIIDASPFWSVPLSTCYLYHPPLYLQFEVFLL